MSQQLLIGRADTNDIIINQSIVSKNHARITFVSNEKIQIEDLESTNHTFVNGEKIKCKIITLSDKVTLGSYSISTESLFRELLKKENENKLDFCSEFLILKKKYDLYEKQVDKLQKGIQNKPMYIKTAITLVAMAVSYFFIENPNLKYPVMMGAGIIGGFLSLNNKSNIKIKDKIDHLSVELQNEYKCPKCGMSLMGKRWKYWAGIAYCPKCNAKWMDKHIQK